MKKTRIIIFLYLFLIYFFKINAQCYKENKYFGANEKLSYGIYYQWGPLNIKLANVVFTTKEASFGNRRVLILQNKTKTVEKYSWIVNADDYYKSVIDAQTLRVYTHIQKTTIDDYHTNNQYTFDYKKQKIYAAIENSNTQKYTDTLKLVRCLKDLLTAVYYTRIIDYPNLKINEKVYLPVILDDQIHIIYFRLSAYENIKLKALESECYVIKPLLIETSTFKSGESMTVWISSKKNRLPLKMESELWVGKIVGIIEHIEGTLF